MADSQEAISCRNCLSLNVVETPNAILAPFFVRRVIGNPSARVDSIGSLVSRSALSGRSRLRRFLSSSILKLAKVLPAVRQALNWSPKCEVEIRTSQRICRDCGFVGPAQAYSFSQLIHLYSDYRSSTYNADRCAVEPTYRQVMELVGKDEKEISFRINHVDRIINDYLDFNAVETVLDWGGGEGRFVPTRLRDRSVTILDYSSEDVIDPSFRRVNKLADGQEFDYIQLCHVLEHVSEPFSVMKQVVSHLASGGYIYIELPQDRSDSDLEQFVLHPEKNDHYIHEHLNLYSTASLKALASSLHLQVLHLQAARTDFGWTQSTIIGGLFRKPPVS